MKKARKTEETLLLMLLPANQLAINQSYQSEAQGTGKLTKTGKQAKTSKGSMNLHACKGSLTQVWWRMQHAFTTIGG